MQVNLVSTIHLLLMVEVDGPAAERFARHLHMSIGNFENIDKHYSLQTQLNWLSTYWINQISSMLIYSADSVPKKHNDIYMCYSLMACSCVGDFIKAFRLTILPTLMANQNLPNLNVPVVPLEVYSHARAS